MIKPISKSILIWKKNIPQLLTCKSLVPLSVTDLGQWWSAPLLAPDPELESISPVAWWLRWCPVMPRIQGPESRATFLLTLSGQESRGETPGHVTRVHSMTHNKLLCPGSYSSSHNNALTMSKYSTLFSKSLFLDNLQGWVPQPALMPNNFYWRSYQNIPN